MKTRSQTLKKFLAICAITIVSTTVLAAFENELPVKRPPAPKPQAKPTPAPVPRPVPPPAPTIPQPGQVFKDCADCPEMVVIPAGSFMMGSPDSEKDRGASEGPQRRVSLKTFALGKTEVTVAQFRRFVNAKSYQTDAERNMNAKGCLTFEDDKFDWREGRNWRNPGWTIKDTEPVACVSHNDAIAYIDWIKQNTGKSYELPSEAQWEYAARAGSQTSRPWGDNPDDACKHANAADKTKNPTNGNTRSKFHDCTDDYWFVAPVATYQANAFGLHDMMGNVWEWTQDVYHDNYTDAPTDGSVWMVGGYQQQRVRRGGSWNDIQEYLRSAKRIRDLPDYRYYYAGFRLARTL